MLEEEGELILFERQDNYFAVIDLKSTPWKVKTDHRYSNTYFGHGELNIWCEGDNFDLTGDNFLMVSGGDIFQFDLRSTSEGSRSSLPLSNKWVREEVKEAEHGDALSLFPGLLTSYIRD